jgi:hypothetical protein
MQIDQKKIELIFRDSSKQPKLKPLCWKILEHFQLPQHSLICIFDDEECPEFTDPSSYGENLCGLFEHVREFHSECPDDLDEYVLENERFLCDVVIYLCYRTCHSPAGMTITFAHELHHFMQYGCEPKAYQANRHLLHISRKYKYDNLPPLGFSPRVSGSAPLKGSG